MLQLRVMRRVRTGLFMNFRVISRASGGRVAENTPTCTRQARTSQPGVSRLRTLSFLLVVICLLVVSSYWLMMPSPVPCMT